ncbi:MAG: ThiF family adenylyltransferase [Alphaproteobacteria bacterium]|nr:ThiF family adenylyltransferase [Alphaproteobacteria bacterium]
MAVSSLIVNISYSGLVRRARLPPSSPQDAIPKAFSSIPDCLFVVHVHALCGCDVIFGCVDSFRERDELERFARRYLIPYIDLGMDVHPVPSGFGIGGQVVLSSAGGPCLRCLGIITDERIRREAEQYGAAGSRPQVVWSNGVLASLAVGLFVQLICPWHAAPVSTACCEFDGNRHRVETNRLDNAGDLQCRHFRDDELGDQFFSRLG